MNITDIRVRKVADKGRLKGSAIITIDDAFVVRDLRVIEGDNGLFIAMPSKKTNTGEYRDIAHPINQETRAMIEEKVLAAYEVAEEPTPYVEEPTPSDSASEVEEV